MGPRHIMAWCLGTAPPTKKPNLSPGRFPELDNNYKKEFENTCKLYGLGPQNIIDMAKKGRAPFANSERP